MATISIEHASKSFGSTKVLKDISLDVKDGEFLVLLGASGCGKSTLLNIIAGLEPMADGTIRLDGEVVNDVHPKNRDIAMVFQSYALYPNMTVERNIAFGLEMRKISKAERKATVREVASTLQIEHLLSRKPSQLSGGQRQRVAMGRALVRRPKIFLFDEPLSNLDAKLRGEMRTEIKKLHQTLKATMVYVTHDQIEAMTLADRIAIMKDGEIQQIGTPQEIYSKPANMYVAGFVGAPPMNFVEVDLVKREEQLGAILPAVLKGEPVDHFLPLPNSKHLEARENTKVILGLRPEIITDSTSTHSSAPEIECDVEFLEPTGADTLCIIRLNGHPAKARVSPLFACPPGESMRFTLDTHRACLFDPTTEQAIT
ncbi:sn-glycerol-3-phosphate import ATP-binding protein UgpC [Pseudovibrio axinellae]|uniref:sn-glycerol-3-phosphate import ATP-binding protein UgpC n=1 Tax=Pseudovibrio axinellae TaxID=989403 RepID=A0A165T3U4_9HYPH|nr:ABC transporter ATP-binding protein [Pseudovibrio axinellae]KZL05394.1 sn-glycerol-3-phosphate import ATP-binding protein UgpC [Pseudovibrio axinellae]SEQ01134.1 carbohydrate ABC transporter ATP-binding protein, CUT1 family [Pseudovibrio axinellae]